MNYRDALGALLRLPSGPTATRLLAAGFPRHAARTPPQAILIVRLDQIGDLVLTSPLIREVRRAFPQAWLSLLVKPQNQSLVANCPYLNEVITFDGQAGNTLSRPWRRQARALTITARLRARRFDLALLPRSGTDVYHGSQLALLSGAPLRIGYASGGAANLLSQALAPSEPLHEAARGLALLAALGIAPHEQRLETWPSPADDAQAQQILGGARPIALACGAAEAKRRWPLERYADVARRVAGDLGAPLLLLGGPDERRETDVLRGLLGNYPVIDSVGTARLSVSAALLRGCRLFIGADSGPLHLAAAAQVPSLVLSCHPHGAPANHDNSPLRFGPWHCPARVLQPPQPAAPACANGCRADHTHCIAQISSAAAYAVAQELYPLVTP